MAEKLVSSSTLQSYDYDDKTYTLTVTYKSNGHKWNYFLVYPNLIAQIFESGGSIGSKFHSMIKSQGYRAVRIQ